MMMETKDGIRKEYYESGKLSGESNWKDGKRKGIAKLYYENGQLKVELNYKDGKKDGIRKGYYESGNLEAEENWRDDKKGGIRKGYYESGKLKSESNWKDDKLDGIRKEYYENGQLSSESNWKGGKRDGITKRYDKNGQLYKKRRVLVMCNTPHRPDQKDIDVYDKDASLVERKIVYIKESAQRSWAKFTLPESIKSKIAQTGTLDHPGFIDLIESLNEDGNKNFLYFTKNIYAHFDILDKILKLQNADNIILLNYKDIEFEPSLKPLPLLMAFLKDIRGEVLVPVNGLSFVTEASEQSVTIKSLADEVGEVTLDADEFLKIWEKNGFIFLGVSGNDCGGLQYMFSNLNDSGVFADKGVFYYLINNAFNLKEVLDRFFVNCRIMRCGGGCGSYLTVDDYTSVRAFCAECSKELKILKMRKKV